MRVLPCTLHHSARVYIYIFRKFSTWKSWHREMAGIYGKEVTGLELKPEALSSQFSLLSSQL